ncbi:DUF1320 family protein [Ignatzschineria rhizosphaerae]|uniref:DUF1320 family protein n=1 Tax=Ignatzschineria rhizosphaerae TaxID=2923279 RepID=A0ABY3X4F5_9GAMM|nr:phage protein Gp36 family protein [Ignatzschineria rhizosphaerae]UNM95670.1 DUF1320 family protein [Ignatzschineria rhizosphaerae]
MSSPYATLKDLLDRYPHNDLVGISARSNEDRGEINEKAVNLALEQASSEIDEYIGARYKLPLTAVSPQLVQICSHIARYYMERGDRTKAAIMDYERSIERLEAVKNGDATLGLDENDEMAELNDGGAVMTSGGTVWGRKDSKGFV